MVFWCRDLLLASSNEREKDVGSLLCCKALARSMLLKHRMNVWSVGKDFVIDKNVHCSLDYQLRKESTCIAKC